jgi:hypothetical protein
VRGEGDGVAPGLARVAKEGGRLDIHAGARGAITEGVGRPRARELKFCLGRATHIPNFQTVKEILDINAGWIKWHFAPHSGVRRQSGS